MVSPCLEPVVHACRRRGFNAARLLRTMQVMDEADFRSVFGPEFAELITNSRTSSDAMHTFCDQLLQISRDETLIWMIRAAQNMQDNNFAYFIQSRIEEINASQNLDDQDGVDIEPFLSSLANVRIEKPSKYSDEATVSEIWRPQIARPPMLNDYFPRPDDEKRLKDAVKDMFGKNRPGIMLVIGEGGIGKTSLTMESIFYNDFFLNSCNVGAVIWLNVYQHSKDKGSGVSKMQEEIKTLLHKTDEEKVSRSAVLIILDDVFSRAIFSAAQGFGVYVITISRRIDVVDANFCGNQIEIERLTDSYIAEMLNTFVEKRRLSFTTSQLNHLVQLCSGLPLLVRIIMAKFRFRKTAADIGVIYRRLCQRLPESIIDEQWDDEKKVATISNLLLMGFEDETERFQQCYSTFLMFKEASDVTLRDLAILWQCNDDEAMEQMMEFSDRSLVRLTDDDDDEMERRLNIHDYLYASIFRNVVTTTDDPAKKETEHLKFRENLIRQSNKTNSENFFHQAIELSRPMLFDIILEVLLHPNCNIDIFWETCTHRADEKEADSTPLHYLLRKYVFKMSSNRRWWDTQFHTHWWNEFRPTLIDCQGFRVPMPALCNIVNKMLIINRNEAIDFINLKTGFLSVMLGSLRDGENWNENAVLTAALNGNFHLLDLLLDEKDAIEIRDNNGCSALTLVCGNGLCDVAKVLLEKKADVEARDTAGWSPLLFASARGHCDVITLLLGNNADVEHRTNDGRSPLMLASQSGRCDVVKLILESKADIESRTDDGGSPLMFAAAMGHCDVVKYLLEKNPDIAVRNKVGQTPLMFASATDSCDVVKLFLEDKADIEARSNNGRSPLMFATKHGCCDIVKLLLENNANIEARTNDDLTPLMFASAWGHCDVVKLLLEHKADIESRSKDGMSALMLASQSGRCNVVELLLENESDIEGRNNDGLTPLAIASAWGRRKVVKLLLENKADIETRANDGRSPLSFASSWGDCDVVKILLENNADIETRSNDGRSPLMFATQEGCRHVTELLLEKKAEINARTKSNQSPLMFASANGNCKIVKTLLENKADVEARDNDGWSPLIFASATGHDDVVKLLLKNNANIEVRTNGSWTPLIFAVARGHYDVAKLLLESKADVEVQTKGGQSPLMIASQKGRCDVVKLLLEKKAKVEARSKDGKSPLMFAAKHGYCDVVKLLLENNADIEGRTSHGLTPLIFATKHGRCDVVKLLLENKADVEARDSDGWSPLMFSSAGGRSDVVKLLLENEANVEAQAKDGCSALSVASANCHCDVVKLLLENKSRPISDIKC